MKLRARRLALATALLGLWTGAAAATTLFGLVDTGELYKSTDQGVNWSAVSTLPVRDAVALGAGATTSELYLASRSGGIYRSTDAGINWTATGALSAGDVADLLVRADLSLLLLTATGGVHRSTDQGANWTALAALTGSDFVSLTQTVPGYKLYALTRSSGVFESLDGGTTWTAKGVFTAPDAVELRGLSLTLYAMTGSGDIYKSTDAASSWTAVGTLSQVGMTGLTGDGTTLIATTSAGEVATSADGASWTWKGAIGQLTVMALGVDTPATTAVSLGEAAPRFDLAVPWPNPARTGAAVSFAFDLPHTGAVALALYDVTGRQIAARAPQSFPAGRSTARWEPGVKRAGLYFAKLRTDFDEEATVRLVVVQ